jgi:hydroxyacylglutathione hydrolase
MEYICLTVNPFQENTWVVRNNGDVVVIDPGFSNSTEFSAFRKLIGEEGVTLRAVLLTHAHVDHVMGLQRVLDYYEVPVYLSHADLHLWENYMPQAMMFGIEARPFVAEPADYPAGRIELGSIGFDVLHTPGHSPDHVSLYSAADSTLVAGDVLFRESIGRTDLYKGDFSVLEMSIREKLYTLPDETRVLPGHGPSTTIGHEKQHNPFVRG